MNKINKIKLNKPKKIEKKESYIQEDENQQVDINWDFKDNIIVVLLTTFSVTIAFSVNRLFDALFNELIGDLKNKSSLLYWFFVVFILVVVYLILLYQFGINLNS